MTVDFSYTIISFPDEVKCAIREVYKLLKKFRNFQIFDQMILFMQ